MGKNIYESDSFILPLLLLGDTISASYFIIKININVQKITNDLDCIVIK